MTKYDIPTPTSFDSGSALETVWEALHGFREDCIPEGDPTYDDQWGDICTAMAWITEALDLPTGADEEQADQGEAFHPEFPDFPMADFPKVWPEGFNDSSWHNDVMPSLMNDACTMRIWINYADPALRELDHGVRYHAVSLPDDDEEEVLICQTDDWHRVLGAIADFRGRL